MKKGSKLILLLSAISIFVLAVIVPPYIRYLPNGVILSLGHEFRPKIINLIMPDYTLQWGAVVNANLLFSEVIAITAFAVIMHMFSKD
ncbi:MAG: hypothetical protein Q7U10_12160 [Thermodesulfovibrionia bacterium]|nr:hypothetical protein [Thermodesulfovibrionia bacterium]